MEAPWIAVVAFGQRPLEHVGIYLGNPQEKAAQIPDTQRQAKGSETVSWTLKPGSDEAVWLGCSYSGTTAMLFRKIEAAVRECTATYDLLATGKRLRLHGVSCR